MVYVLVAMMSISSLAYILFGQWLLAYKWELFEISGYEYGFPDFIPFVMLPVCIWLMLSVGPDVRFFRTVMLDEMYQDYVRTARAKGLQETVVVVRHALKNVMIPVVTLIGLQAPLLIGGSVILEKIFVVPGMGSLLLEAVFQRDYPVITGVFLVVGVAVLFINLLVDLTYGFLDPRVRH